jgi:hypothetical protein
MKICLILLFVFAAAVLIFPSDALACACCADAGTYSIGVRKPSNSEFNELKKLNFGATNLFTTPGYPDDVKGISSLGDNYSSTGSFQNNLWKFNITGEAGESGTLNLLKPTSMVDFKADLHDSANGGNEPVLYKEWRFKSRVQSGTGIFQKGIAPATEYFLILQGRGNNCTQAEDFTHWRLEITGKKASYAFFGKLNAAS